MTKVESSTNSFTYTSWTGIVREFVKKIVNFSIWISISTRVIGSLALENLGWTLPMLETYVGHWNYYYIGYVPLCQK